MNEQPRRRFGTVAREWLGALARDRSLRQAAIAFVVTRLAILAIFVVVGAVTYDVKAPGFNPHDPHPTASIQKTEIKKDLRYIIGRGDAGWYLSIAQQGYERGPFETTKSHNWVFFPLFPLLMAFGGRLTGDYLIFGALLSNALFFVSLILLHKLVGNLGHDEATADRAVFYTAIFPVSYFFSLPLTESLFLCLNLASFLAAARNRWWAAGLFGAFASATRLSGVLLLPTLAIFYWQRTARSLWRRDILWLGLVPIGLVAFMFFLWRLLGNPLAFADAIEAWRPRSGFFLVPVYEYLKTPLHVIQPWNFRLLNFATAILAFGVVIFWLRRKAWAFAALTFLAVLLPLSSLRLDSLARYVSVVFPVFIALALAGREPWVDRLICTVFVLLFGLMTFFYAVRFSFASA